MHFLYIFGEYKYITFKMQKQQQQQQQNENKLCKYFIDFYLFFQIKKIKHVQFKPLILL
jgi:hypothetical protein